MPMPNSQVSGVSQYGLAAGRSGLQRVTHFAQGRMPEGAQGCRRFPKAIVNRRY